MQTRSTESVAFLQTLHAAILDVTPEGGDAHRVTTKIMTALQTELPASAREPISLPVCSLLGEAIDDIFMNASDSNAEDLGPVRASVVEHARAMQALSPQLAWWRRSDAEQVGEPFSSGHANATIIGKGGLEERDDVGVGISLIAPNVQYPVHHHPPEEVYLVMSPGHWQQAGGAWHEPGCGAFVHNPPDVLHSMRSGSRPLLATWCLWTGRSIPTMAH